MEWFIRLLETESLKKQTCQILLQKKKEDQRLKFISQNKMKKLLLNIIKYISFSFGAMALSTIFINLVTNDWEGTSDILFLAIKLAIVAGTLCGISTLLFRD